MVVCVILIKIIKVRKYAQCRGTFYKNTKKQELIKYFICIKIFFGNKNKTKHVMYVLLGWSVEVRKIHSPHCLTAWKQQKASCLTELRQSAPCIRTKNSSSVPTSKHFCFSPTETNALTSLQCHGTAAVSKVFSRAVKTPVETPEGGLWLLTSPRWTLSKTKLESVFHCVGTFPGCRKGRDLWLDRIRWLLLLRNSNCEREFWLLRLLESWQEVGRDVLGFHPGAAATFRFPSLVQGHVPFASRVFSSMYCWGIGVIAVFLKSLPELAVICKFGLGGGETDI